MNFLLLISGTPASGKDAIFEFLASNYINYSQFKKHKAGAGGKADASYIHISEADFQVKSGLNEFIQSHSRYGRHYGVSRQEIETLWGDGKTPIIHIGSYKNIQPFMDIKDVSIFSVLLLTSRLETLNRLEERHQNNQEEIKSRLAAYDEERIELAKLVKDGVAINFDLILDNTRLSIALAGKIINDARSTLSTTSLDSDTHD